MEKIIWCEEEYNCLEPSAYHCPYAKEWYGTFFAGVKCELCAPAECPMKDPEKKIIRARYAKYNAGKE